jgi:CheY-like chemotaxis protein
VEEPPSYEEIGRLAERVAHDLTNSLSASLMHLRFLRQSQDVPMEIRESLREIEDEAKRAAGLTRELLVLSRKQTGKLPLLTARNAAKPVLENESEPPDEAIRGGNETILLVEDEMMLSRMEALSLRKLGYAVLEAAHESEALDLWKKNQDKIALLIADLSVPGELNGYELAQQLATEKPDLKIIITSGNGAALAEFPADPSLDIVRLMKPCPIGSLAMVVRECLDKNVTA